MVETPKVVDKERHWPGQVFAELEYEEAIQAYVQQTRDRLMRQKIEPLLPEKEATPWRRDWEARAERHRVLQQRRQADADWRR